jgi:hypothetical protein
MVILLIENMAFRPLISIKALFYAIFKSEKFLPKN